ncbi:MAG: signal peptide peptidase SppA [Alphaproteobacteria bacterium]|nr:signal peptide peptidase SppA [Alphaproteobacteria bacterium]MCB9792569.1 signal peptide peptidase SppA [Alphaproteobacteria bacterium]
MASTPPPAQPPAPPKRRGPRLLLWITALGMLLLTIGGVAVGVLMYDAEPEIADGAWLGMRLSGSIEDGPLPDAFVFDPEQIPLTLHEYAALIDRAAEDEGVEGLYLELDGPGLSMAQVQELRGAIGRLRAADKHCVVWSKTYDNLSWYLANACDEVHLHPEGVPMVIGLSLTTEHYAATLEKVGVQADYEKMGRFKSAVETFEATEPSEATQEMYIALLDSLFNGFVADSAVGRGLSEDEVRALIDDPPITATDAMARGLVDALTYRDELIDDQKLLRDGEEIELIKTQRYAEGLRRDWRAPAKKVAVVHLQGTIIDGESSGGGFGGGAVIGDASVVPQLDELAEDEDIVAVVLRVDSPGGSALASDVMWRAVQQLNEVKPVVVSMGSYAASGGYYISMGARHVFAEPATLTGSIGVYAGKLAISGLLEKAGVGTWTVSRGELAGLLRSPAPFTDAERAKLRERIEAFYTSFITKAAEGRGMEVDAVDAVAQGRVWTGAQALEVGLVDELGDLRAAVNKAAELAGEDPAELGRKVVPRRLTFLEALTESLEQDVRAEAVRSLVGEALQVPEPGQELLSHLERATVLQEMLSSGGVAAIDPVRVTVR